MYGLTENIVNRISQVFHEFPEIEYAILYGSRAKGNFKPSSDIDITLQGKRLNLSVLNRIALKLDDLLLPNKFDLSIYSHITNTDLLDHIDRIGKVFYKNDLLVS